MSGHCVKLTDTQFLNVSGNLSSSHYYAILMCLLEVFNYYKICKPFEIIIKHFYHAYIASCYDYVRKVDMSTHYASFKVYVQALRK